MSDQCKCGRSWNHCLSCGSKNLYLLKIRSRLTGKPAYSCKACGNEFELDEECKAPLDLMKVIPSVPVVNDSLPNFDDPDYVTKAGSRLAELIKINGMSVERASSIMKAEGWRIIEPETPVPIQVTEPIQPPLSMDEIMKLMSKNKKEAT
jgi:hypothetical protein